MLLFQGGTGWPKASTLRSHVHDDIWRRPRRRGELTAGSCRRCRSEMELERSGQMRCDRSGHEELPSTRFASSRKKIEAVMMICSCEFLRNYSLQRSSVSTHTEVYPSSMLTCFALHGSGACPGCTSVEFRVGLRDAVHALNFGRKRKHSFTRCNERAGTFFLPPSCTDFLRASGNPQLFTLYRLNSVSCL